MRFMEEMKLALRRRNKNEMVKLCEEIEDAQEDGYELYEEEEILWDRITDVLERMQK